MFYLFLWWLCLFFGGVWLYGVNEMCSLHADNYEIFFVLVAVGIVGSIILSLVLYFFDKE